MASKIYEVIKPLTNRETNEVTPPGTLLKLDEELAKVFLPSGSIRLTKRKSLPKENTNGDTLS